MIQGIAAYGEALRCLAKKTTDNTSEAKAAYIADRQDRLREVIEKIKHFLSAKK